MNKWQQDVLEFQNKFRNYSQETVKQPPDHVVEFRKNLIIEEVVEELLYAMDTKDIEKVADGITDSIYVLLGTALAYGIDVEPIWQEIHRSNMEKIRYDDSDEASNTIHKVVKPDGWKPPDVISLLEKQGWKKNG